MANRIDGTGGCGGIQQILQRMNGRNGKVSIVLAFQTNFAIREFSQLS